MYREYVRIYSLGWLRVLGRGFPKTQFEWVTLDLEESGREYDTFCAC